MLGHMKEVSVVYLTAKIGSKRQGLSHNCSVFVSVVSVPLHLVTW